VFFGPPTLVNIGQAQTLDQIASSVLGDPSRWREIADANNIDDPLNLPAGKAVVIPGTGGR
jgi:nucleoid-associated protein YgaU